VRGRDCDGSITICFHSSKFQYVRGTLHALRRLDTGDGYTTAQLFRDPDESTSSVARIGVATSGGTSMPGMSCGKAVVVLEGEGIPGNEDVSKGTGSAAAANVPSSSSRNKVSLLELAIKQV